MSDHCNENPCPVNGIFLAWEVWSPCSVTCGRGSRVRSRACIPPKYGGLNCTGPLFEINDCIQVPCQINGDWSCWQNSSACSGTCGEGVKTRTRTCNHPTPANGGLQCRGESHMSEHCNDNPCPAPPAGVACPTCTEDLECTWNTTCHVSENCMVRSISVTGFNFTTHCIMKEDCHLLQMLAKTTHGEVFCCADENCVREMIG
ncbi:mucin-like protein [Magallana gigas]|uniref:mucin-like protein n=1 Tax=Magallana gigas TaxID=29159 RepID=UPI00333E91F3